MTTFSLDLSPPPPPPCVWRKSKRKFTSRYYTTPNNGELGERNLPYGVVRGDCSGNCDERSGSRIYSGITRVEAAPHHSSGRNKRSLMDCIHVCESSYIYLPAGRDRKMTGHANLERRRAGNDGNHHHHHGRAMYHRERLSPSFFFFFFRSLLNI